MKNAKEYKKRLETAETYNGMDFLDREEVKALREDVKERKKKRQHKGLDGSNGRATWYINENGEKVLTSYYTDVVAIKGDKVRKIWDGYSVTTMKHINLFLFENGLNTMSKHEWIML